MQNAYVMKHFCNRFNFEYEKRTCKEKFYKKKKNWFVQKLQKITKKRLIHD